MSKTTKGWVLFSAGYAILIIADYIAGGLSERLFYFLTVGLMVGALLLLFEGTRGKGGLGIRVLLVITQFWIGYALAALVWLIYSNLIDQ